MGVIDAHFFLENLMFSIFHLIFNYIYGVGGGGGGLHLINSAFMFDHNNITD